MNLTANGKRMGRPPKNREDVSTISESAEFAQNIVEKRKPSYANYLEQKHRAVLNRTMEKLASLFER
jgi:hypothetical protein